VGVGQREANPAQARNGAARRHPAMSELGLEFASRICAATSAELV
jgi:hypothetical protein